MAARCPAAFVAHPHAHFLRAYSLILSAKPALLTKALRASPYPPCLQLICLLFSMASLMRLLCHGRQLLLVESLGWEVALKMRNSLAHWLLVWRVDKGITALDIGPDGVRSRSWRPAFSNDFSSLDQLARKGRRELVVATHIVHQFRRLLLDMGGFQHGVLIQQSTAWWIQSLGSAVSRVLHPTVGAIPWPDPTQDA